MTDDWKGWFHHMGLGDRSLEHLADTAGDPVYAEASIAYYQERRRHHLTASQVAQGMRHRHQFLKHTSARQLLEAEATG